MKTVLATLFILSITLSSCEKKYECTCTNPGSEFVAFSLRDKKQKAIDKCAEYYNENFSGIPANETHCEIQ